MGYKHEGQPTAPHGNSICLNMQLFLSLSLHLWPTGNAENNIRILNSTWLGGVRVNDKWTWIDGATWTEFENLNMKENDKGQDYLYMDRAYVLYFCSGTFTR